MQYPDIMWRTRWILALNRARLWFSICFVKPQPKFEIKRASVFCKVLLYMVAMSKMFHEFRAAYSLVVGSPERYVLLYAHNLDMVEVLRRTPHDALHWVNLTLFDNPAFRFGHDPPWSPFW